MLGSAERELGNRVVLARRHIRVAERWQEQLTRLTSELAEQYLDELAELEREHGMRLRTVAGMLNTTEGTIKNTLFRATHKLRTQLAEVGALYGGDESSAALDDEEKELA